MEAFGKLGAAAAAAAQETTAKDRSVEAVRQIIPLLKARGGFFAGFSDEVLAEACRLLEYRNVKPGTQLFRRGGTARELCVVASGHVRVLRGEDAAARACAYAFQQGASAADEGLEIEGLPPLTTLGPSPPPPLGQEPAAAAGESGAEKGGLGLDVHLPSLDQGLNVKVPKVPSVASLLPSEGHWSARGSNDGRTAKDGTRFAGSSASPSNRGTFKFTGSLVSHQASHMMPDDVFAEDVLGSRLHMSLTAVIRSLADQQSQANGRKAQPKAPARYRENFNDFFGRVDGLMAGAGARGDGAAGASAGDVPALVKSGSAKSLADSADQDVQQPLSAGDAATVPGAPAPDVGSNGRPSPSASHSPSSGASSDDDGDQDDDDRSSFGSDSDASGGGGGGAKASSGRGPTAKKRGPGRRSSQTYVDLEAGADTASDLYGTEATAGLVLGARACLAGTPHEWTAVAASTCELLVLRAKALREIVELERKTRRISREQALCNAVPSLRKFDKEKLERLAECFRSKRHRRGTVLCLQGESRTSQGELDRLQVIVEGRARVVKACVGGEAPLPDGAPASEAPGAGGDAGRGLGGRNRAAAMHTWKDVGALQAGHVVNGTSQLLGGVEEFTVVCESSEVVVISAARSDLTRVAGSGVLDGLRAAAEMLNVWHQERWAELSSSIGHPSRSAHAAAKQYHGHGADGQRVGKMPIDMLHAHDKGGFVNRGEDPYHKMPKLAVPPAIEEYVTPISLMQLQAVECKRQRRRPSVDPNSLYATAPVLAGRSGRLRQRRYAKTAGDDGSLSVEPYEPERTLSRAGAQSLASTARRRPSISDALINMSSSQEPRISGLTSSMLVDASLGPEDIALLTSRSELPASHWSTLPLPSRLAASCAAQLQRREEANQTLLPWNLVRIDCRGDRALMVPVAPIDPPLIRRLVPSRHSDQCFDNQRRLIDRSVDEIESAPEETEENLTQALWGLGGDSSAATSLQESDSTQRFLEDAAVAAYTVPVLAAFGTYGAHGTVAAAAAVASAAAAAGRGAAALPRRHMPTRVVAALARPPTAEGIAPTATPLARPVPELPQAHLDAFEEALAAMQETMGELAPGAELEGADAPQAQLDAAWDQNASQMSTQLNDSHLHSVEHDEDSMWEQMYSRMSQGTDELSRGLQSSARLRLHSGDRRRPPPAHLSGARPRSLMPLALPQTLSAPPSRPPRASPLRRLVVVQGRTGRRAVAEASPLHVHSIERHLVKRSVAQPKRYPAHGIADAETSGLPSVEDGGSSSADGS